VTRDTAPPVLLVLSPPEIEILPPGPYLPLPRTTLILPEAPPVADPDLNTIAPLLPADVVPVEKERVLLTPV
jgi:hypothetical protein